MFHVFWGDFYYEYFCCFKRYAHTFKTKSVQNLSPFRFVLFSSARAELRALYLASTFWDFKKNPFSCFFGLIFTMNIFVTLINMGILSKQKMFKINHSFAFKINHSFCLVNIFTKVLTFCWPNTHRMMKRNFKDWHLVLEVNIRQNY